jgi:hypothetical protein
MEKIKQNELLIEIEVFSTDSNFVKSYKKESPTLHISDYVERKDIGVCLNGKCFQHYT